MIRGTTPTHTFTLPFAVETVKSVRVIYAQGERVVFTKEMNECELANNTITIKLTQSDTLAFDHKTPVDIQVRILTVDDDSLVSDIRRVMVDRCLDNEVLE